MVQRFAANGGVGIADGAVLVILILKDVGIDGAGTQSVLGGHLLHVGAIGDAVGQIPEDVQGDGGANAGQAMDLSGIG